MGMFPLVFSALAALFSTAAVLLAVLAAYIADSISIVLGSSFLGDYRWELRGFLGMVLDPAFGAVFLALIAFVAAWMLSRYRRGGSGDLNLEFRPLGSKKVAVTLVAYNEESVIGPCVREFVGSGGVEHVIVVDNNSSDGTAGEALGAGAQVVTESRQGYGFACLRGLREALKTDADIIILCEGDNTQSGRDVEKFLAYIDTSDMVVGTRTVKSITEKGTQMSQFYMWGNYFISFLIQLKYFDPVDITNIRLTDAGCTYRAIRRRALEDIIGDLVPKKHHFAPHMILVAIANNLSVMEIPIVFRRRRGESKGAGGKKALGFVVGLQMIWEIITG